MIELLPAILTKANGNTTLSTAINSDIYFERADMKEATTPYITFHVISETPRRVFRSADDFEDVLIQFSIFHKSTSVEESLTVLSDLNLTFDRQNLTYTTKASISSARQSTVGPIWMGEDDVWMTVATYRIMYN